MTDKPKFYNPPTPQHEAVQKEKEAIEAEKVLVEKEAPIQEEIKREIEEVIAPPKPLEWWIKTILLWSMGVYTVLSLAIPFFRDMKRNIDYRDDVEFYKNNPELVKAVREWKVSADKDTLCTLQKTLKPTADCK
jgi:hypothetical protein